MFETKVADDLKVADLRQIQITFIDGETKIHIVHKDDVEKFIEATIRLHHSPGKNPHNGRKTAPLGSLEISDFAWFGPFWWTTSDLQKNNDPNGARLLQGNCTRRVLF